MWYVWSTARESRKQKQIGFTAKCFPTEVSVFSVATPKTPATNEEILLAMKKYKATWETLGLLHVAHETRATRESLVQLNDLLQEAHWMGRGRWSGWRQPPWWVSKTYWLTRWAMGLSWGFVPRLFCVVTLAEQTKKTYSKTPNMCCARGLVHHCELTLVQNAHNMQRPAVWLGTWINDVGYVWHGRRQGLLVPARVGLLVFRLKLTNKTTCLLYEYVALLC